MLNVSIWLLFESTAASFKKWQAMITLTSSLCKFHPAEIIITTFTAYKHASPVNFWAWSQCAPHIIGIERKKKKTNDSPQNHAFFCVRFSSRLVNNVHVPIKTHRRRAITWKFFPVLMWHVPYVTTGLEDLWSAVRAHRAWFLAIDFSDFRKSSDISSEPFCYVFIILFMNELGDVLNKLPPQEDYPCSTENNLSVPR